MKDVVLKKLLIRRDEFAFAFRCLLGSSYLTEEFISFFTDNNKNDFQFCHNNRVSKSRANLTKG